MASSGGKIVGKHAPEALRGETVQIETINKAATMISRSAPEIQKKFLNEIEKLRIAVWGFNAKPSGQSFYRKDPNGKWVFHISFIPRFDITADVAVRNEAIEAIVNRYDSKLNSAESEGHDSGKQIGQSVQGEAATLDNFRACRYLIGCQRSSRAIRN